VFLALLVLVGGGLAAYGVARHFGTDSAASARKEDQRRRAEARRRRAEEAKKAGFDPNNPYLAGNWFIVTGKNKLTCSDPAHQLVADSAKWDRDAAVNVLVLPADTAWLVRFSNGGWYWGGLPASLVALNVELSKANRDVKSVALMAQGGWALLHDEGELRSDGIPSAILAQIEKGVNELKTAAAPRSLAFAPDGGWVLLSDKDYREHGLPEDLSEALAEHKRQGVAVRCVAFDSRGEWFLLDNQNECLSSDPDHPAFEKLQGLRADGQTLRSITFSPGVYTHGYVLEHRPVRKVQAALSTAWSYAGGGDVQWAVLPNQAPEMPRQRGVKVALEPAGVEEPDGGALKQKARVIRVAGKPGGFEAKAAYEMTLYTNRLVPRLAGQTPDKADLSEALVPAYTRVTEDMRTKVFEDFLTRADLRRAEDESDLAFARRCFLYVCKRFRYVCPNPARDVIEAGEGDCGGLSWLFVRVMRAGGVPARALFGRHANSAKPADDGSADGEHHVKAEFFAEGIGWVGAEVAGGVGVKGNPLVCFGNEGGDFVVLDLDVERLIRIWPEDRLTTKLGGAQGMHWWFRGAAPGQVRTKVRWTVQTLSR
jgi:hypothetical protein